MNLVAVVIVSVLFQATPLTKEALLIAKKAVFFVLITVATSLSQVG